MYIEKIAPASKLLKLSLKIYFFKSFTRDVWKVIYLVEQNQWAQI